MDCFFILMKSPPIKKNTQNCVIDEGKGFSNLAVYQRILFKIWRNFLMRDLGNCGEVHGNNVEGSSLLNHTRI